MKRMFLTFSIIALFSASALNASFKVDVNTKPGFLEPMTVAVVVAQCQPAMNCTDLANRASTIVATVMKNWRVVPKERVRQALFEQEKDSYSADDRESLAAALEAEAFFEVAVQSAATGDGNGGLKGSEVNLIVRLVRPGGQLLLQGSGAGRPRNVVTSPERVGANVIEKILEAALKKR
jgi:hypothetical protein